MKRWNIQHVARVGQRKILRPRRESNPRPSVQWSDSLTTELLGGSWL